MMTRMLVIGASAAFAAACAANGRTDAAPETIGQLWVEPRDIAQRNLLLGPGGRDSAPKPNARYRVLEVKTTGTQPGYDVEEIGTGTRYSVKLGVEARTEVTVSRILWAVGYHQPILHYVPRWVIVDGNREIVQPPARFRREPETFDKKGEWSWLDNPFTGSRELAGLFTLMIMFNNWDIKTEQNALYQVTSGKGDTSWQFVVRDVGATLGTSRWPGEGTKDNVEAFEGEGFIAHVEGNRVQFEYAAGFLVPQLIDNIAPADVRWISGWLSRLTDEQWRDAFRAGGFKEDESRRFIAKLKEKVAEGLAARDD